MAKKAVASTRVVKTKGPYVQGVEVTDAKLVFTSGVVARDVDGIILGVGDIRAQTRQCFENIRHIIEAAGGGLDDLVKVTVFLRPGQDYAGMNDVKIIIAGTNLIFPSERSWRRKCEQECSELHWQWLCWCRRAKSGRSSRRARRSALA
jgi:2-iminobutanoate/2-iminopropanoate deaminase